MHWASFLRKRQRVVVGAGIARSRVRHTSKAASLVTRYAEMSSRGAKRQATMLDASTIPSLIVGLIVGAAVAYAWGRRQNRHGDRASEVRGTPSLEKPDREDPAGEGSHSLHEIPPMQH